MKLVEQHVIKRRDPRDIGIDEAAFASNNLMNVWFLVNISRAYGGRLVTERYGWHHRKAIGGSTWPHENLPFSSSRDGCEAWQVIHHEEPFLSVGRSARCRTDFQ